MFLPFDLIQFEHTYILSNLISLQISRLFYFCYLLW